MIKKFIFLTGCLIIGQLAAYEHECTEKTTQNCGRYQMQIIQEEGLRGTTKIYVLDKEKGTVWVTMQTHAHNLDYSPWIALPLPIQELE